MLSTSDAAVSRSFEVGARRGDVDSARGLGNDFRFGRPIKERRSLGAACVASLTTLPGRMGSTEFGRADFGVPGAGLGVMR